MITAGNHVGPREVGAHIANRTIIFCEVIAAEEMAQAEMVTVHKVQSILRLPIIMLASVGILNL